MTVEPGRREKDQCGRTTDERGSTLSAADFRACRSFIVPFRANETIHASHRFGHGVSCSLINLLWNTENRQSWADIWSTPTPFGGNGKPMWKLKGNRAHEHSEDQPVPVSKGERKPGASLVARAYQTGHRGRSSYCTSTSTTTSGSRFRTPGYGFGQVRAALEEVFRQAMPAGMGFRLGLEFQEQHAAEGVPSKSPKHAEEAT